MRGRAYRTQRPTCSTPQFWSTLVESRNFQKHVEFSFNTLAPNHFRRSAHSTPCHRQRFARSPTCCEVLTIFNCNLPPSPIPQTHSPAVHYNLATLCVRPHTPATLLSTALSTNCQRNDSYLDHPPTMLRLTLTHNGRRHPTPLHLPLTTALSSLHTELLSHLSLPAGTTLRLLVSGTQLAPTAAPISATPLATNPSLYILSTPPSTLSSLLSQKPDPLIRPFGKAPAPKYTAAPRATRPTPGSQPSDYGFARVEALPGFPDTVKAQEILEELSTDPGFLHVMRVKRWRVGALKEMPPEGRVGVDPVCVLGYNTNKGQEIHLRLRTDDRKGFRSRMSVRQVLAHELAHNEVSDHNNEFKELMRWIEREADKADWRDRKSVV